MTSVVSKKFRKEKDQRFGVIIKNFFVSTIFGIATRKSDLSYHALMD